MTGNGARSGRWEPSPGPSRGPNGQIFQASRRRTTAEADGDRATRRSAHSAKELAPRQAQGPREILILRACSRLFGRNESKTLSAPPMKDHKNKLMLELHLQNSLTYPTLLAIPPQT